MVKKIQHQIFSQDDGAIQGLEQFVFPLLKFFPHEEKHEPIGTGFFIAPIGLFVTARHVIEDLVERDGTVRSFLVAAQLNPEGGSTLRSVDRFFLHPGTDVAIGFLKQTAIDGVTPVFNASLGISLCWPITTQVVRSISFPLTLRVDNGEVEAILLNPHHAIGKITQLHRRGRDRVMLRGPCYETSLQIYGGSSGGPVFDDRGRVFGVHSTGFDDFPVSYVIPLSEIMEIPISGVELETHRGTNLMLHHLLETGVVRADP